MHSLTSLTAASTLSNFASVFCCAACSVNPEPMEVTMTPMSCRLLFRTSSNLCAPTFASSGSTDPGCEGSAPLAPLPRSAS